MKTRDRKPDAFTLIELLVAMAVLMILVLLLFSVFSNIASSYAQTESRAESYRDGRASLHLMAQEFQSLVDTSGMQTNTNAVSLPRVLIDNSGSNSTIGFVARVSQVSQPTNDAYSDVCGVAYFVAGNTNAGQAGCSLYRTLIPSDEMYSRLKDGSTNFITTADCQPDAPHAEPMADNVVDFKVKILDSTYQEVANPTGGTNEAYVEIDLTVIGSRYGQTYFQQDTPDARKERIRELDGRTFTLRAPLIATPN